MEKTILSPLNYIEIFVRNQVTIYMWVYFWTPYSLQLISHSLICSITVSLKIRISLPILFFFKIILAIFRSFVVFILILESAYQFLQEIVACWDFAMDWVEFIDKFGEIWLNESFDHTYSTSFIPFIWVFLNFSQQYFIIFGVLIWYIFY